MVAAQRRACSEAEGVTFEGSVQADLAVVRHQDNLLIKGRALGRITGECARCLAEFHEPLAADFTIYAERRPEGGTRGLDRELEADQYLSFHDGVSLDIGVEVREALLLSVPIQPLCREDCRGLCPGCGANLNQEPCTCARRAEKSAAPGEET
jgi:uncharacterized protein